MRVIRTTFRVGLLFVSSLSAAHAAVTVLTHGYIYTGTSSQPWAQAIAFRDDQIVAVGDEAAVLGKWRRSATVRDLKGRRSGHPAR